MEILPIKAVHNEDLPLFGSEAVMLCKLVHAGLPVASGIVVTPPHLQFKTTLEHWDFSNREIIEQKLLILKKEFKKWPIPESLIKDTKGEDGFLVNDKYVKSTSLLWLELLQNWLELVKQKIFLEGFNQPVTDALEPQIVIFTKNEPKTVITYFDDQKQLVIEGYLTELQAQQIKQLTIKLNHLLIIPHKYFWLVGDSLKLISVRPYNSISVEPEISKIESRPIFLQPDDSKIADDFKTTVKLFYDLTAAGLVMDHQVDGIFLDSGKIFKPEVYKESFEELLFKLIESAATFRFSPILFKLADLSEKWGDVRGALRLIHQKSLFNPLSDALLYARNKRGYHNISLVIPYTRGVYELDSLKRELAAKKIMRKNSLNFWLEADLPENLLNLEDYLQSGIDGVILNIDQLASHLLGFDFENEEVAAYKSEIVGLLAFLEDGLRLLHKTKKPFLAIGKFALEPEVLHFLVEKGIYGLILPKYEIHSAKMLVHQAEKKVISARTA